MPILSSSTKGVRFVHYVVTRCGKHVHVDASWRIDLVLAIRNHVANVAGAALFVLSTGSVLQKFDHDVGTSVFEAGCEVFEAPSQSHSRT